MELSNKSLALLLVSAIVISLGGTIITLNNLTKGTELTGFAVGNVSLGMATSAACAVNSNVSFGSATYSYTNTTTLSTNAINTGPGFNDCLTNVACTGMVINNTGNVHLAVSLQSNLNASTMLGGPAATNDDFQFAVFNGTNGANADGGCVIGMQSAWNYTNETDRSICTNFTYFDSADAMIVEYNVTIDQNTPPGAKTSIITITCAQN
jgi:hypothetical protein